MSTKAAAKRLARHVLARREELDMSQVDVWFSGGPSNTTLTKIEAGEMLDLNRSTARKLDLALQWERGSARGILDGADPVPLLGGVGPRDSARLRRLIGESDLPSQTKGKMLEALDEADAG